MKNEAAELHQPFDTVAKLTLEDEARARKILRDTLPREFVPLVDFESLARLPGSFVSPELREFFSDFLFSVRLKDRDALVLIVVEHKSYLDRWAPIQVLLYVVLAWRDWVKNHPECRKLPPVLPFILYHGESDWTFSTGFSDLIGLPEDLREVLGKYQPSFELALLDAHRLGMAELAGKDAVTHLFLGSLKAASEQRLEEWLRGVLPRVNELPPGDRGVIEWIRALFLLVGIKNEPIAASTVAEVAGKLREPIRKDFMNMIEALEEKGRQEGWQKGRQEGWQQGNEAGRQEGQEKGEIIGQIRAYQKLFKLPILTPGDAQHRTLVELQRLLAVLEGKDSPRPE